MNFVWGGRPTKEARMKLLTHQKPEVVSHRYLVNGSPRNCAYCRDPLQGEILRRGDRYFCNELCADAAPEQPGRLQ